MEKINEIVSKFLTDKSFNIENYVDLIIDSGISNKNELLTYKAFKTFRDNKSLQVSDILNFTDSYNKNGLQSLNQLNAVQTDTIKTYCETHVGDENCICSNIAERLISIYQIEVSKWEDEEDVIQKEYDTAYSIWNTKRQNQWIYFDTIRTQDLSRTERTRCYTVGNATANDCITDIEPRGEYTVRTSMEGCNELNCTDLGWPIGTVCTWGQKSICKRSSETISRIIKNEKDSWEVANPTPTRRPIKPRPIMDTKLQCCINSISNVTGENISQSCNQSIITNITRIISAEQEKALTEAEAKAAEAAAAAEAEAKAKASAEAEAKAAEAEAAEAAEAEAEAAAVYRLEISKLEEETRQKNKNIIIIIVIIIIILLLLGVLTYYFMKTK